MEKLMSKKSAITAIISISLLLIVRLCSIYFAGDKLFSIYNIDMVILLLLIIGHLVVLIVLVRKDNNHNKNSETQHFKKVSIFLV
ncbi:hypothetical protein [Saliterribacillus persicus]|uniref:Uncharacterized protein n=1 Tax=Saliterribacillus persicus TaxID=930114 RepID=A0A368XZ13_9BACI|nr:hypothetical protein [Saliterribacillus persicus]RCW73212.1 hypothetical protein DFR57_104210 [Saliterribacillus persicus]